MKNITASDRSALVKLAASLPAGSPERKLVLSKLNKKAYGLTTKKVYEDHLVDMSPGDMRKFLRQNSLKDLYPNESDETLQLVADQLEKCISKIENAAEMLSDMILDTQSKFWKFSEYHDRNVKAIRHLLQATGSPGLKLEAQLEQFILAHNRAIKQSFDIHRFAHNFFND